MGAGSRGVESALCGGARGRKVARAASEADGRPVSSPAAARTREPAFIFTRVDAAVSIGCIRIMVALGGRDASHRSRKP